MASLVLTVCLAESIGRECKMSTDRGDHCGHSRSDGGHRALACVKSSPCLDGQGEGVLVRECELIICTMESIPFRKACLVGIPLELRVTHLVIASFMVTTHI